MDLRPKRYFAVSRSKFPNYSFATSLVKSCYDHKLGNRAFLLVMQTFPNLYKLLFLGPAIMPWLLKPNFWAVVTARIRVLAFLPP